MNDRDDLVKMFQEFLELYKLVNEDTIKGKLEKYFTSEQMIEVYKLSDGERTLREIGDIAGISHVTVKKYWDSWKDAGIVEEADRAGRYKSKYNFF